MGIAKIIMSGSSYPCQLATPKSAIRKGPELWGQFSLFLCLILSVVLLNSADVCVCVRPPWSATLIFLCAYANYGIKVFNFTLSEQFKTVEPALTVCIHAKELCVRVRYRVNIGKYYTAAFEEVEVG